MVINTEQVKCRIMLFTSWSKKLKMCLWETLSKMLKNTVIRLICLH